MFRQICNPSKFIIRICNPLEPYIYKMMYVGERIANPHLETVGLQIRRNKECLRLSICNDRRKEERRRIRRQKTANEEAKDGK